MQIFFALSVSLKLLYQSVTLSVKKKQTPKYKRLRNCNYLFLTVIILWKTNDIENYVSLAPGCSQQLEEIQGK